jgi:small subunit ribosomal protein S21
VFREMKRASFYEKPSEKKAREKSEAIRRARKLARKQAIREGLIAAPVKKPNDRRPTRVLPSVAPTSPKPP